MSEQGFKKEMLKEIGHTGHFSQVESHATSAGIPDINYCICGVEGNVELKYANEKENKTPKIRPSQVAWFRNRVEAGGNCWLFLKIDKEKGPVYLLIDGVDVPSLVDCKTIQDWEDRYVVKWYTMEWGGLVYHLVRGKLHSA